ncbi:MAG: hypothetical protein ACRY3E_03365 [Candidatus Lariskella arthropodorum]
MAPKGGSKNNISNRGKAAALKKIDGREVKPVMYKGARLGHGNFIAAKFDDGKLALDATGKPIPYQLI